MMTSLTSPPRQLKNNPLILTHAIRVKRIMVFASQEDVLGNYFCRRKKKLKFKSNTVTPSEDRAWNEHSEGKGTKRRSHNLRLFGSRSTKASTVKSNFDKPYNKNADVRKLN